MTPRDRTDGSPGERQFERERTESKNQRAFSTLTKKNPTFAKTKKKIKNRKKKTGLLLRAAFHDAGTYNPNAPAGTSQGGERACFSQSFELSLFNFSFFFLLDPRRRPGSQQQIQNYKNSNNSPQE